MTVILPYSSLQNMMIPPNYLLYKFSIDGIQYYGRVQWLHYDQKFNVPSSGTINIYNSVEDFKNGISDKDIEATADKVVILDVIDTHSASHPSPINSLINICANLNNIPNNTDIGTLRRNIPNMLEELSYSIQDFSTIHPAAKNIDALEDIKGFINDCKKSPDNFSVEEKALFIMNLKERIYYLVDNLIRFSETTQ